MIRMIVWNRGYSNPSISETGVFVCRRSGDGFWFWSSGQEKWWCVGLSSALELGRDRNDPRMVCPVLFMGFPSDLRGMAAATQLKDAGGAINDINDSAYNRNHRYYGCLWMSMDVYGSWVLNPLHLICRSLMFPGTNRCLASRDRRRLLVQQASLGHRLGSEVLMSPFDTSMVIEEYIYIYILHYIYIYGM